MNRISAISAFALMLFATGICQADSLVITFRSGKTQTVVLDEPSVGINSWQFVGGTAPQKLPEKKDEAVVPAKQEQVQKDPVPQVNDDKKLTEKAPEKKSGIRVKWNAKPIAD